MLYCFSHLYLLSHHCYHKWWWYFSCITSFPLFWMVCQFCLEYIFKPLPDQHIPLVRNTNFFLILGMFNILTSFLLGSGSHQQVHSPLCPASPEIMAHITVDHHWKSLDPCIPVEGIFFSESNRDVVWGKQHFSLQTLSVSILKELQCRN